LILSFGLEEKLSEGSIIFKDKRQYRFLKRLDIKSPPYLMIGAIFLPLFVIWNLFFNAFRFKKGAFF